MGRRPLALQCADGGTGTALECGGRAGRYVSGGGEGDDAALATAKEAVLAANRVRAHPLADTA